MTQHLLDCNERSKHSVWSSIKSFLGSSKLRQGGRTLGPKISADDASSRGRNSEAILKGRGKKARRNSSLHESNRIGITGESDSESQGINRKLSKNFFSINRETQALEDNESSKGSFNGATKPLLVLSNQDRYASDQDRRLPHSNDSESEEGDEEEMPRVTKAQTQREPPRRNPLNEPLIDHN